MLQINCWKKLICDSRQSKLIYESRQSKSTQPYMRTHSPECPTLSWLVTFNDSSMPQNLLSLLSFEIVVGNSNNKSCASFSAFSHAQLLVTSLSLNSSSSTNWFTYMYRVVQLYFTPEIEVFSMLFDRCHCKRRKSKQSTVLVLRMADRIWKETKQEPGTAGQSNMLGCC